MSATTNYSNLGCSYKVVVDATISYALAEIAPNEIFSYRNLLVLDTNISRAKYEAKFHTQFAVICIQAWFLNSAFWV